MLPWSFTMKWLAEEPPNEKASNDAHPLPLLCQIDLVLEAEPFVKSEPVKRLAHSRDLALCATPDAQLINNEQGVVAKVSTLP